MRYRSASPADISRQSKVWTQFQLSFCGVTDACASVSLHCRKMSRKKKNGQVHHGQTGKNGVRFRLAGKYGGLAAILNIRLMQVPCAGSVAWCALDLIFDFDAIYIVCLFMSYVSPLFLFSSFFLISSLTCHFLCKKTCSVYWPDAVKCD